MWSSDTAWWRSGYADNWFGWDSSWQWSGSESCWGANMVDYGNGKMAASSSGLGAAWSVSKNTAEINGEWHAYGQTGADAQGDQSKAGCKADPEVTEAETVLIPLAKARPMKIYLTREFETLESQPAVKSRDPRLWNHFEETRIIAEIAAMEVEDTLASAMRLNAIMEKNAKSQKYAALKVPRPPPFPPPGFVGPGPGAPPKKSCGPPPSNVPPTASVGPQPPGFPPPPSVNTASKPCKFIPTPGDDAGMQLRKLKDRHNERESRRRARRAREAE
eukprot:9474469-Pyramimonas_sp.AAC.1